MRCGDGCFRCCHGLFDVPLPDALAVAEGYRGLPDAVCGEASDSEIKQTAAHAIILDSFIPYTARDHSFSNIDISMHLKELTA
jgi:hypothetical protein